MEDFKIIVWIVNIILLPVRWILGTNKIKNIENDVSGLKTDVKVLKTDVKVVRECLISYRLLEPFTQSDSPKRVTEKGKELLDKQNVDTYLDSNCELLKDPNIKKYKEAGEEVAIYIESLNWAKSKKAERKVVELMYNSNMNQRSCEELLALAIVEKIISS